MSCTDGEAVGKSTAACDHQVTRAATYSSTTTITAAAASGHVLPSGPLENPVIILTAACLRAHTTKRTGLWLVLVSVTGGCEHAGGRMAAAEEDVKVLMLQDDDKGRPCCGVLGSILWKFSSHPMLVVTYINKVTSQFFFCFFYFY